MQIFHFFTCLLLYHVTITSPTCTKKSLKSHRWNRLIYRITCRQVPPNLIIKNFNFLEPTIPQDFIVVNSVVPKLTPRSSLSKLEVLRKLILKDLDLEEITPGAFAHFKSVRRMDLSLNSLRRLEGELFQSVVYLNLSHNKIYDIDLEVFARTADLNKLDLSYNQLTLVWNDMFGGCSNLRVLDISCNRIEQLQPHAFRNAFKLVKIDLSHNQIVFLHENVFFLCQNLRLFDVSYNRIKRLELNEYKHVRNLSKIDPSYNRTLYTLKGQFPYFLQVHLSHNSITEIKSDSLSGMVTLFWKINLSHNKVANLEGNIFENLALDTFDISGNDLSQLKPSVFKGAIFLRTLDLSNNNLSSVNFDNFAGAYHLQKLSLQNNQLNTLSTDFFVNLPFLCSFNVSGNKITSIDGGFFKNGHELKYVDLSYNDISNVTLTGLTNLRLLSLKHNQIRVLRKNLFINCLLLTSLDVSNNKIRFIESTTFKSAPNLDHIDLSYNEICKINPNTFTDLIYLLDLNLEHNQLSVLHNDMFVKCLHLQKVNVAYNTIKKIEPNFFRNKNGVRKTLDFYLNGNGIDWGRVEMFLKVFSADCVSTILMVEIDMDVVCCGQLNVNRSYIFLALSKNNNTCRIETKC